jgi:hypothetical protein
MQSLSALGQKYYGTDDPEQISRNYRTSKWEKIPHDRITKMTLPYYAPDPSLPPLPTIEEIGNALMDDKNMLSVPDQSSRVVRVNSVYAVKFSRNFDLFQVSLEYMLSGPSVADAVGY